ncbi:hypothetical protein J6590_005975 [Homalodisca vitripennis]|nr:hypothetical protein J6590_005975 [Homalodisca vitripennis]
MKIRFEGYREKNYGYWATEFINWASFRGTWQTVASEDLTSLVVFYITVLQNMRGKSKDNNIILEEWCRLKLVADVADCRLCGVNDFGCRHNFANCDEFYSFINRADVSYTVCNFY